jgi:hypothetical protein
MYVPGPQQLRQTPAFPYRKAHGAGLLEELVGGKHFLCHFLWEPAGRGRPLTQRPKCDDRRGLVGQAAAAQQLHCPQLIGGQVHCKKRRRPRAGEKLKLCRGQIHLSSQ